MGGEAFDEVELIRQDSLLRDFLFPAMLFIMGTLGLILWIVFDTRADEPLTKQKAYVTVQVREDCLDPHAETGCVLIEPDPCIAQMESAMRAMEPWVQRLTTTLEEHRTWVQAWEQWAAAKAQCWRAR